MKTFNVGFTRTAYFDGAIDVPDEVVAEGEEAIQEYIEDTFCEELDYECGAVSKEVGINITLDRFENNAEWFDAEEAA